MTGLDYIVLFVIGVAAVGGFMRGLAREVLSLAAWFLAAFAVHYLHQPLAAALLPHTRNEIGNSLLAFCVLLLVPYAAMKLIAGAVSEAPEDGFLGPLDRVLGFGFGAVKGVMVAVFAFSLLAIGYDDVWGYRGRPVWIVTARSYPAIDTFSRELVPLIAQKRETLRGAAEEQEKAAADAARRR